LDFDPSTEDSGFFGINLHHGYSSSNVNNNSAGCQVLRHKEHLNSLLDIAEISVKKYGDKITYTLLTEEDFE
jgi:hypothetical protein